MNKTVQYATDLLYVIDAKKKILECSNQLTVKLSFTKDDLQDLEDILREFINENTTPH